MSRIGRSPITVPDGVEVEIDGRDITVTGPKGSLRHTLVWPIEITQEDGTLRVSRPNDEKKVRGLHGLSRTLVSNMVVGVTDGYRRTLEIRGVGYRVQARGSDTLEFSLGYSHPITLRAPEGVDFQVETPTRLHVSGIDKQKVGETAARIRKLRRPDPYKNKGIRYEGESLRRKVGKAGK